MLSSLLLAALLGAQDPTPEARPEPSTSPELSTSPGPSTRPELPDPAAISARLAALVEAHPRLASVETYGRSAQGRPPEVLRLALDGRERPGLLLIAGLDPVRPFEPWLAVEVAQRVAYAVEGEGASLLSSYTLYVLPVADPDGHLRGLDGGPLGAGPDADDDRDGRRGEDPPADLDGDGFVLTMRVPDPRGDLVADPHDPRAGLEREALADRLAEEPALGALLRGGAARFRIDPEGRDADGDGVAGEDPAGDRRFDANFPAGWPEHAPRAGRYPTGDPAVRALCDWVLAREDLILVIGLGAQDHLRVERRAAGAPTGRVPASGPTSDDLPWLAALDARGREALGLETGGAVASDDAGHFMRWAYDHRGLWTVGVRPWVLPTEPDAAEDDTAEPETAEEAVEDLPPEEEEEEVDGARGGAEEDPPTPVEEPGPAGEPSEEAGRLAWIDQSGEAWRFVPWRAFEHPELGPVELGGFVPGAHSIPPRAVWPDLVEGTAAFLFGLGDTPPRLVIERCTAVRLDEGLWRVEVRVANHGWLPSSSGARERSREGRTSAVELRLPDGASLLSNRARIALPPIDGGAGVRSEWLVRVDDPAELTVVLESPNAGVDSATPTPEEAR